MQASAWMQAVQCKQMAVPGVLLDGRSIVIDLCQTCPVLLCILSL